MAFATGKKSYAGGWGGNIPKGATLLPHQGSNWVDYFQKGSLPEKYLAINGGGGMFSDVAKTTKKINRIENLINDDTDDHVVLSVATRKGPATLPVKIGDKVYRPNAKGQIRIVDDDKIDQMREVHEYRKQRVDEIMAMFEDYPDDSLPCFIFGMESKEWEDICGKGYKKLFDNKDFPTIGGKDGITWDISCTLENIDVLLPGQAKKVAIEKLRKIVGKLEGTVNREHFKTSAELRFNMRTGLSVDKEDPDNVKLDSKGNVVAKPSRVTPASTS